MTRRDNYISAARREEHQWIPLDFGLGKGALKVFHRHCGENADPVEYFDFNGRWLGPAETRKPTPDWRKLYYNDGSLPESVRLDPEWGTAFFYEETTDNERMYFPLRNITTTKEVDDYPWPDVGADDRYEELIGKVMDAQEADYVVHVSGVSFFESVWNLRGFEQLLLDMAEGSPVAARLFERLCELNVRCCAQAARCGADVLLTGSDVASQRGPLLSPAMWQRYVLPMMRDCIKAAKAIKADILVLYHSCGDVSDMIEGFIEAGIDILDPCQPEAMDIFELKRRYGDVLAFHGGIGVQSILPFGTPQEVRDMVRKTIDIMADGGGYLCSTSHNLRPEIPWENIMAFVETVREYGTPASEPNADDR